MVHVGEYNIPYMDPYMGINMNQPFFSWGSFKLRLCSCFKWFNFLPEKKWSSSRKPRLSSRHDAAGGLAGGNACGIFSEVCSTGMAWGSLRCNMFNIYQPGDWTWPLCQSMSSGWTSLNPFSRVTFSPSQKKVTKRRIARKKREIWCIGHQENCQDFLDQNTTRRMTMTSWKYPVSTKLNLDGWYTGILGGVR